MTAEPTIEENAMNLAWMLRNMPYAHVAATIDATAIPGFNGFTDSIRVKLLCYRMRHGNRKLSVGEVAKVIEGVIS